MPAIQGCHKTFACSPSRLLSINDHEAETQTRRRLMRTATSLNTDGSSSGRPRSPPKRSCEQNKPECCPACQGRRFDERETAGLTGFNLEVQECRRFQPVQCSSGRLHDPEFGLAPAWRFAYPRSVAPAWLPMSARQRHLRKGFGSPFPVVSKREDEFRREPIVHPGP